MNGDVKGDGDIMRTAIVREAVHGLVVVAAKVVIRRDIGGIVVSAVNVVGVVTVTVLLVLLLVLAILLILRLLRQSAPTLIRNAASNEAGPYCGTRS